jgi:hypothetical protein
MIAIVYSLHLLEDFSMSTVEVGCGKLYQGMSAWLNPLLSHEFYRDTDKKKYRLAKWGILCRPKDQGGLGIIDLEIQNICLLSKWIVNLLNT